MIACIWDYSGKDSKGTAEHFEKHLKEFITIKKIQNTKTGIQTNGQMQSFVWCCGDKKDLILIIDLLKPKHYLPKENFNEYGIFI